MLPERIRLYLLRDLEATPALLDRVTGGVTEADLDRRPDPERFTVREVLAHLADWEAVFLGRLRQCLAEDGARFPPADPAQAAISGDYAHADPAECRARFRQRRRETLALLRGLDAAQWEQAGTHAEVGPLTVETQVVMMASHDGYHLQQIMEWLPD